MSIVETKVTKSNKKGGLRIACQSDSQINVFEYLFEQKSQVKVLEPITCISLASAEGTGNLMMSFEWESDGH